MHREHNQRDVHIQYPVVDNLSANIPKQPDVQSTANHVITIATEPTRQLIPTISQEKEQDQDKIHINFLQHPPTLSPYKEPTSRVASHNIYHDTTHEKAFIQPEFYQPVQSSWLNLQNPLYKVEAPNFPEPKLIHSMTSEPGQNVQNQASDNKSSQVRYSNNSTNLILHL